MGLAESLKGNTATDFEVRGGGTQAQGPLLALSKPRTRQKGRGGPGGAVPAGLRPFSHLGQGLCPVSHRRNWWAGRARPPSREQVPWPQKPGSP